MNLTGFRNFVESIGGGSFLPTSWTGSEGDPTSALSGHPVFLPGTDFAIGSDNINIPNTSTEGVVKHFEYKQNPIMIELENGTKLAMTFDQYKNISGDLPIIPKFTKLSISFQRDPNDNTSTTSKIQKCFAKFIGPEYLKASYKIKNKNQMP